MEQTLRWRRPGNFGAMPAAFGAKYTATRNRANRRVRPPDAALRRASVSVSAKHDMTCAAGDCDRGNRGKRAGSRQR